MRRRVFLSGAILTGVGLPLLAGCKVPGWSKGQGGSTTTASASASAGGASGVPAASAAPQGWQQLDAHVMGHHLGFQVSPLVRRDEKTTVLALKLTRAKDDAAVKEVSDSLNDHGSNVFEADRPLTRQGGNRTYRPAAGGVRLLDLPTNRVWLATTGVEQTSKDNYANTIALKPGETTTCFVLFGAVDAKQVTVFVPQAGFVTVNVLDKGAAAASGIDFKAVDKAFDDVISYSRDESKPIQALAAPAPIERYTQALDDSTSTLADNQKVTVTLASDVTFASDSADLAPAADAQLKTVAGQLAQYPDGGTLTIVGHTDDVQDDAYNQTLSEKRANAVKTRLEQLTSLDKWQTSVSGKGESEPKINDTSDQARAANRRVEITLTPTGGTTTKNSTTPTPNSSSTATNPSSGKLPDPQGPVAKGPEGVTLTTKSGDTSGEVTITLDHVTRSGGYLLGTVTCTVKNGSTGAQLHPLLQDPQTALSNQRDEDGSAVQTLLASDGLTLLSNGERIFPADYLDAYNKQHLPLTELNLYDRLKGGTTTVCVVWPDPGGDTTTLDHPKGKYSPPDTAYRLTNIPIKNS